jgi:hypothetical protein
MKLVMTLLARDEADVVDAQVAFHLNAGVDFVVATDHRSVDGTTEILEAYAREGRLHLIRKTEEGFPEQEWITAMARLAASQFGADWVINATADEFWWPRGQDLKHVFASVPGRYGLVRAFVRNFVPRPDDGKSFAERMTVRLGPEAPINDPASPYRPLPKVAHRGDPHVSLTRGSHALMDGGLRLQPLRGWYPIEVLHFPLRSIEQCGRKSVAQRQAFSDPTAGTGTAYHSKAYEALLSGDLETYYGSLVVDDDALARGLEDGSLALDTRLRDVLRMLGHDEADGGRRFALPGDGGEPLAFPIPDVVDDAAYAVDAATLGEADVVRLQRRVDQLEQRLAGLESRLVVRAREKARRLLRRESSSQDGR